MVRAYLSGVVGFLLCAGFVQADPSPLPEVEIEIGRAVGLGTARVPIYLRATAPDGWLPVGLLVDVEWDAGLVLDGVELGEAFSPFGEYAHVTANDLWRGSCPTSTGEPGSALRAIALGYSLVSMDLAAPALWLTFSGPPGDYVVRRTCWHRGDNPGDPSFYTFAADVVFQKRGDPTQGWDVLDEWPSTGVVSWVDGGVTLEHGTLPVAGASWSAIKALYR